MKNEYVVDGEDVRIKVFTYWDQRWREAVISAGDFERANQFNRTWYAHPARKSRPKFYVMCKVDVEGNPRTVLLHRVVMNAKDGDELHHVDNDGLNNRRSNLEWLSHRANMRARFPKRDFSRVDANMKLAAEYREERRIAKAVQEEFELTRHQLWNIRVGRTKGSSAALAYFDVRKEAGVRSLEEMKRDHPRPGQKSWGALRHNGRLL